ncbi:MAG: serine/threonine protein kinase [Deltaproteobacteria bacterium]|nr:serine/threonine protein kinase [Deltaproteobacteria bacterium]
MIELANTVEDSGVYRELLPRGTAIGRYIILQPIGRGGIGTVYAAFDPELDRKVAIKVMRPETLDRLEASEARGRMQREAQAMARLAHPNVVAVYDVAMSGDDLFVAMELIEGATIARWLTLRPRTWREIRDQFVQAARGLAAAHVAGLIHRDLKPENIMVGSDGRVRVLDFGLARAAAGATVESETTTRRGLADTQLGGGSPLGVSLTRTGTLLGTPAYMSPEQHLQQDTDERSDQFSLCVALYEALYGERPFGGTTVPEIGMAVLQGKLRPPPKSTRVPGWLRAAVVRGLAAEPTDRYRSVDELIVALLADPAARRRKIALGAAAALAIAGAAVAGHHMSRASDSFQTASAPENLDFEQGPLGDVPSGWFLSGTNPAGYRVVTIASGCAHGERCAELQSTAPVAPDAFGTLMQTVGAASFRSKRVRLRMQIRSDGHARALPWLRVDRPKGQMGYFYNSMFEHAAGSAWEPRDIVGNVDADAISLNYGLMIFGNGSVFVDAAEIVPVRSDVPLTADPIEHEPQNLDFEADTPGREPSGWLLYAGMASVATITTADPHGGRNCVALRGDGTQVTQQQEIDAAPLRGKRVVVAAYVKAKNEDFALSVMTKRRSKDQWFEEQPIEAGEATSWRLHRVIVNVAQDAERIVIGLVPARDSTVYVDDVAVTVIGTADDVPH